jgi:anti-sigma factor RsiW
VVRFPLDHLCAQRRLSAYAAGELGHAQRRRVERHLAACPSCSRSAGALGALLGGLTLLRERDPPGVAGQVIARLHRESSGRRGVGRR